MNIDSLPSLIQYRAKVKCSLREFLGERGVTEVDAPALQPYAVTDLHIDSLSTDIASVTHYLQSSPEYFMKRLLCAGAGDIYSLAYAYRDGEKGRRHHPEFTLLEWYRVGWNEYQLMQEVFELLVHLGMEIRDFRTLDYGSFFVQHTGLNPLQCELRELQDYAAKMSGSNCTDELRSICLDLIFSIQLESLLPEGLVFIHNFPECQSALASLGQDAEGNTVARRFEAFIDRMEIANGYHELTDAAELRQRFERDQQLRLDAGKPEMAIDERLLSAMERGMPQSAGVALGLDRVLMKLLDCEQIEETLPENRLKTSEKYQQRLNRSFPTA